jgi:tetratricopeptide (TPR) repeat protein
LKSRYFDYSNWLNEAAWIFIGLNFFNLLPIYPLDGRQIADLLLFSGNPYIGVCFKILGVFILGLLGFGKPMILFFAILIASSIPNSFRSAKINLKLRRELKQNPANDRKASLKSIFHHLKKLGYDRLPFGKRYAIAKDLLQRQHEYKAKWTTRLLLVAIYFSCLFGTIFGSLVAIAPNWSWMVFFENSQQTRQRHLKTQQQEFDRATEAIRRNPDDLSAYLQRINIRRINSNRYLNNTREMLDDYDRVIQLDPNNMEHRFDRAHYFGYILKDNRKAFEDYNWILQKNPKNVRGYTERAELRNFLKDYKRAIADYNKAIELSPQNTWSYISRGYARQELGDYRGAIADAEYAIKLEPNSPDGYGLRSEVRRHLGDEKGAIDDLQKAEMLEP